MENGTKIKLDGHILIYSKCPTCNRTGFRRKLRIKRMENGECVFHRPCQSCSKRRYHQLNPKQRIHEYVVFEKGRPKAVMLAVGRRNGTTIWRSKHRVIMEQVLGRPLGKGEVVRFKDGNPLNCLPENLYLTQRFKTTVLGAEIRQ